jgi:hypothetical protein
MATNKQSLTVKEAGLFTKYDREHSRVPEASPNSIFNLFLPARFKYAPWWLREIVGGDEKKQEWAGNISQAAVYAALLASIGYGSRKLLRGMAPETQKTLESIDKYVPSSDDNPYAIDSSRLIDKSKYKSPADKAKAALKRVFTFKNASADEVNSLGFLLPPGAALMGWMVGQKLAEKEIQNTTLSDSKARLAKARADYNRVLAKKLNPDANIKEKVIADRMQNPLDWGIDKGIEVKDKITANAKKLLFGKQAKDPVLNMYSAAEQRKMDYEKQLGKKDPSWWAQLMGLITRIHPGIQPALTSAAALALFGSGLYAWNNYRAQDKNLQKALDKEAAIKRRAQEANDQRLDLDAILPEDEKKKKEQSQSYGGAMNFSF